MGYLVNSFGTVMVSCFFSVEGHIKNTKERFEKEYFRCI